MGRLHKSLFQIESQQAVAPRSFLLTLRGDTSAITGSGQFVQVALPGRYLRRPISVCDFSDDRLTLLYKIMGAGTGQMAQLRAGDSLELLTGLGRGFDTSACRERALLVGGGMGVAPLYRLAKDLLAEGKKVQVVLGFNEASEICLEEEFRTLGSLSQGSASLATGTRSGLDVIISTADGSRGVKGFVTDAIKSLGISKADALSDANAASGIPAGGPASVDGSIAGSASASYDYFYTCGPIVMMKAVCALCPTDGQASLEERMGCGFGICYGCAVATQDGPRRVCADGPVFTKSQLGW